MEIEDNGVFPESTPTTELFFKLLDEYRRDHPELGNQPIPGSELLILLRKATVQTNNTQLTEIMDWLISIDNR